MPAVNNVLECISLLFYLYTVLVYIAVRYQLMLAPNVRQFPSFHRHNPRLRQELDHMPHPKRGLSNEQSHKYRDY